MRLIAIRTASRRPLGIIVMIRMLQRLGDDIVLEGGHGRLTSDRTALTRATRFINRPTNGAMIDDRMRGIAESYAVHCLLAGIAKTATNKPHVNIAATAQSCAPVGQANPVSRRGLAGNCHVSIADDTWRLQSDQP